MYNMFQALFQTLFLHLLLDLRNAVGDKYCFYPHLQIGKQVQSGEVTSHSY